MTKSILRKKGFILVYMFQEVESIMVVGASWQQPGEAVGQYQEAGWSHFHLQTGNGWL